MVGGRLPGGLTAEERRRFEADGYVVVREALSGREAAAARASLTALAEEAGGYGYDHQSSDLLLAGGLLRTVSNPLARESIVLDVALHPGFFPKIYDAFSGSVRLLSNEYFITPPGSTPRLGWHRDSTEENFPAIELGSSLLLVNALVLLSDVGLENGPTLALPGSHRWGPDRRLPSEWPGKPSPGGLPGHVQLCGEAGTAVFFNARLFHAQSENRSDDERHALVFVFGHRWMRGFPGFEPRAKRARALAGSAIDEQVLGLGPAFDEPVAPYEPPSRWTRADPVVAG